MEQPELFKVVVPEVEAFYLEADTTKVVLLARRNNRAVDGTIDPAIPAFKVLWMDHLAMHDARENSANPFPWKLFSIVPEIFGELEDIHWIDERCTLTYKGKDIFLDFPQAYY